MLLTKTLVFLGSKQFFHERTFICSRIQSKRPFPQNPSSSSENAIYVLESISFCHFHKTQPHPTVTNLYILQASHWDLRANRKPSAASTSPEPSGIKGMYFVSHHHQNEVYMSAWCGKWTTTKVHISLGFSGLYKVNLCEIENGKNKLVIGLYDIWKGDNAWWS